MTPDPVARMNANLLASAVQTASWFPEGGAVQRFGALHAMTTGLPIPMFNRIIALEPPGPGELEEALRWMRGRGVPFLVSTCDDALDAVLEAGEPLGIVPTGDPQPGMTLELPDEVPEDPTGLEVSVVRTPRELEAFLVVFFPSYGMPPDTDRSMLPEAALADPVYTFLLGRLGGDPAACGMLVVHEGTAGVYTVGVPPAFRRRGLGTAMTWAVLQRGIDEGCDLGVLQASEMGYGVYERMGFRTRTRYHDLAPTVGPAEGEGP